MLLRLPLGFVRFFFHLLYHQFAWAYDAVAWLVSLGQWNVWGQNALPHLQGQRILELAHGPGHLLVTMRQRGLRPIGLDLSPAMGRLAHRRLRQAGLAVPLVRARAQALPFRAGALDSVAAAFPTEFILDPATLRETARVLKSGGRLVIVPNVTFHRQQLAGRFLEWLYTVTGQRDLPPPSVWAIFEAAGFTITRLPQPAGAVEVRVIVAEKTHSG
jgi:ubiquinone/menaquinone biosynthesis C-methylase UbiE